LAAAIAATVGVGRPEDILPHGIALHRALPGVGQNLQDHLDFTQGWTTRDTDNFGLGAVGGLRLLGQLLPWKRHGEGLIATPFAEGAAFLKTRAELERPDIQLHFCIAIVDDHARKLHAGYGFSCTCACCVRIRVGAWGCNRPIRWPIRSSTPAILPTRATWPP
jgi:choline dehydrogenase-like flavoprotein